MELIAYRVASFGHETVEQVCNTLSNAAQTVVDTASAVTDTVKGGGRKASSGGSENIPFDSMKAVIMSTSADHLLDSLASYLGEATPGQQKRGKDSNEKARQAAVDAILNVPNQKAAQQIVLGAKKWLLESVNFDERKLGREEDWEGRTRGAKSMILSRKRI
ncbi:hypothetical protein A4X13_0g3568 [Tilletia indica]|uniref:Uncharacterized protein n=1 Tax=Tilletia indica TaxID=43049 RepID=A0A177TAB3_9BASI|nr:hypothetical protein A4X13_0g3568 [Tilletia indica]